jgi:hypothetical protein
MSHCQGLDFPKIALSLQEPQKAIVRNILNHRAAFPATDCGVAETGNRCKLRTTFAVLPSNALNLCGRQHAEMPTHRIMSRVFRLRVQELKSARAAYANRYDCIKRDSVVASSVLEALNVKPGLHILGFTLSTRVRRLRCIRGGASINVRRISQSRAYEIRPVSMYFRPVAHVFDHLVL